MHGVLAGVDRLWRRLVGFVREVGLGIAVGYGYEPGQGHCGGGGISGRF